MDEILKKGEGREGGRGLRKGSGGAAGAAEAEQSWRPPKKWTHSSCVQKWESREERGSRGAVLARCSFRSIALLAPIGNGAAARKYSQCAL